MKAHFPSSPDQQPVPLPWRPTLTEIVEAFVSGNYTIEPGISGVAPVSASTASQIANYLTDYGATLVPLPQESWNTSVCSCNGRNWEVLVDLYTEEEGRSDLVMHAQVEPSGMISVHAVYVP